jgi:hypothetical protein
MIRGRPDLGWRRRYNAVGTEEWARLEPGAPSPEAVEAAARAAASVPEEGSAEAAENAEASDA